MGILTFLYSVPVVEVTDKAPKSMSEHFDFIWLLLVIAIGIVVYFAGRTLNKIDKNQTELFNRLRETENSLQFLKGEHESMCARVIPILNELAGAIKTMVNREGGGKINVA